MKSIFNLARRLNKIEVHLFEVCIVDFNKLYPSTEPQSLLNRLDKIRFYVHGPCLIDRQFVERFEKELAEAGAKELEKLKAELAR